jgi:hypothetical protein
MGEAKHLDGHPDLLAEAGTNPQDAARQRRAAALKAAEGLWKNRTDIPKDGVQAQEQLRAEWR